MLSLSLTSLDSKFCSVSQVNVKITNTISKKDCSKTSASNVPELGRLGPEIPKDKVNIIPFYLLINHEIVYFQLELLKKRQDYGQKVSLKNKIKMIEKRLLQNLQQEIKECKKNI